VAGIAAACFLNVSDIGPASFAFAFVFHHPAHFPALRERFNSIQNDDHRILRHTKNNSQRHDRTSILDFATDNILDELDDESRKNEDGCKTSHCGSSSSRSSSLVVATSTSLDSALDSTSSTPAAPSSSSRHLPPWLASVEDEFAGLSAPAEASKRIRHEIEYLETALVSFRGGDFFSKADVRDVIRAIHWCAASSNHSEDRDMSQKVSKIVGSVSFCRLLLQLEDDTFDIHKYQQNKNSNRNNNDNSNNTMDNKSYLITKDVLLASILHYSECVDLRYDGLYDDMQNSLHENSDLAMLSTITDDINNEDTTHDLTIVLSRDVNSNKHRTKTRQDSSMMMHSSRESKKTDSNNDLFEDIFSIESLELANAAARLKRVEILTSVTLTSRKDAEEKRRPLKKEEYTAARNLMVSLTDDWRALAIRCVASLFRLEGILKHSKINAGTGQFSRHHSSRSRIHRGAEITLAAKDSLQMYANLSEQMGLHRLHSQLEAKAFRILYPRQYSASSVLFQEHGTAMNAISGFLSNQLKQLLCEDLSLMYELENLEVISRVKEPYSFWKKLLKKRNASIAASANINKQVIDNDDNENRVVRNSEQNASQRQMMRSAPDLSILDVNDVVALRVIFNARKLHADEPVETTRERERMLCYYIHHVLRSKWPETDINSVKDYVRYPKPNGYQSLHHTSKIMRNRQDFFFEVQVRSEEMHRLAEFGVAAHSAYKLAGSGSPTVLPSLKASPSPSSPSPVSSTVGGKLDSSVKQSSALTIVSKTIANDGSELPIVGLTDSGSSGPYIHALEKARQRLMQSDVYVFLAGGSSSSLETGQLLTLTAGCRIIDVLESLRKVNEEFAFKNDEVRVWCNGDLAPLDENIKNGDTILIQPIHPLLPPSNEIVVNKTSSSSNKIVVSKTKKDVEREIPILRKKNSAQI
jgi:ppGpp synthetase/RelA/SpoT-type nucleotidyltranferase